MLQRLVHLPALLVAVFALSACRPNHRVRGPRITSLVMPESSIPPLQQGESYVLDVHIDYEGRDTKVSRLSVSLGDYQSLEVLEEPQLHGTHVARLALDARLGPGVHAIRAVAVDERGRVSQPRSAEVRVDSAAEAAFEIFGVSPSAGRPGDVVRLEGRGFGDSAQTAMVTFGGTLARAEVIALTEDTLEVRVPPSARTGKIAVVTAHGRRFSPAAFEVAHTMDLSPGTAQVRVLGSVQLTCSESGDSSAYPVWTLNGHAEDAALGTIDPTGLYVAPSEPPVDNPVIVRCQSGTSPDIYAEAAVRIVPEVPFPGEGTIASAGGELRSARGDVSVSFPAGAVSEPVSVRVESLDVASVSVEQRPYQVLAAARFSEVAVALRSEPTVRFALQSWVEPGTDLALLERNEASGVWRETDRRATVESTGLQAVATLPHFSAWAVALLTPAERLAARTRYFAERAGDAGDFRLRWPDGLELVEGASVPALVELRAADAARGLGPFLSGVQARLRFGSGGKGASTPVVSSRLLQPSGDGWSLAVLLDISVLTLCGAGERADAFVDISLPSPGDLGRTLSLPLEIACLDELDFDLDNPPWPLPDDVGEVVADGERVLSFPSDGRYRFSRVYVGPGGVLSVREPARFASAPALQLDVSTDVLVEGVVRAQGAPGQAGKHGRGETLSGVGGAGGNGGGGSGGQGGPTSLGDRGVDGRTGQGTYAGSGGRGGACWESADWISVAARTAKVLWTASDIYASPYNVLTYAQLARDAYALGNSVVRFVDADENYVLSAGHGGGAGPAHIPGRNPGFWGAPPLPQPGGGGGGSGRMLADIGPHASGGGGGGGGGAAPNVMITAGGFVRIASGAAVYGEGGRGGRGGNGSSKGWSDDAAPGAGGGGGSGAGLHVVARDGLQNNGRLSLSGGLGNLSGEVDDDHGVLLFGSAFGAHGRDGILRVDGPCEGTCSALTSRGPYFHDLAVTTVASSIAPPVTVSAPASFALLVNGRESGTLRSTCPNTALGQTPACHSQDVKPSFTLDEGLNVLSMIRTDLPGASEPHAISRTYVFRYPGASDQDQDGLTDAAEIALGTDPKSAQTDDDRLEDFAEVLVYHTDPRDPDSDDDSFVDGLEVLHGYDPLDPNDHPPELPKIVSTQPVDGASDVSVTMPLVITFSEPMDRNDFTLVVAPATPLAAPRWSEDRRSVTLSPVPVIRFGTRYTLSVDTADLEGYPLAEPRSFAFTTERGAPPLATNGSVNALVAGDDGSLFLGGSFYRVGRTTGGAFPLHRTTGALLDPYPVVNGEVWSFAEDGEGGLYVGGAFERVGDTARINLAHIDASGHVNQAFAPALVASAFVRVLAADADHVFVATDTRISAHAVDDGVELWSRNLSGIRALAAHDGELYVGRTAGSGSETRRLLALDADSGDSLAWDPRIEGPDSFVDALIWSGDTLYVGGVFQRAAGATRTSLAAFDAQGSLRTFNPGVSGAVAALAWHGSALYVGGQFTAVGGVARANAAAVDAQGALLPWAPSQVPPVLALTTAGGYVYVGSASSGLTLTAYDASGQRVWAPPLLEGVSLRTECRALVVRGDAVYAGGFFPGLGSDSRSGLAALDVKGALLPWNPTPTSTSVSQLVRLGTTIITDSLEAFDSRTGGLLWKRSINGSIATMVAERGVAYLGGSFRSIGDVERTNLAALDAAGNVTAWSPPAPRAVSRLAAYGGRIYVAGATDDGSAAFDTDGAALPWTPGLVGWASDMVATVDAVYVVGPLRTGTAAAPLVALGLDGSRLPFLPRLADPTPTVTTVAVEGVAAFLGGHFGTSPLGYGVNIAAVDARSGDALPFDHAVYGQPRALLAQGSRVWVAGSIFGSRQRPAQGLVALDR